MFLLTPVGKDGVCVSGSLLLPASLTCLCSLIPSQSWGGHSRDVIAGTCSYVGALLLLTSCKALLMGTPLPPLLICQICSWPLLKSSSLGSLLLSWGTRFCDRHTRCCINTHVIPGGAAPLHALGQLVLG